MSSISVVIDRLLPRAGGFPIGLALLKNVVGRAFGKGVWVFFKVFCVLRMTR